jgi:MOSC domain-containing protein YiiM
MMVSGAFRPVSCQAYDVSLIEEDMCPQLEREALRTGNVKALRRNIVVSGGSLAALIKQPFQIGALPQLKSASVH